LLYGAVGEWRNWLYDHRWLKSIRFDFPVISVGNLSAGGTGKSPHIEYLIKTLQYVHQVATLSRGYGRKTHGYIEATAQSTASDIGDEPWVFKQKFPETTVVVNEDRVMAIPKLLDAHPELDVILLDDAYQHRGVRQGLSILLTEFNQPFMRDEVLPLGWLRERKSNYNRADIIIVTKCPFNLTHEEADKIVAEIKPFKYQRVFFTTMAYGHLYSIYDPSQVLSPSPNLTALMLTGIAKTDDLFAYLKTQFGQVYKRTYKDHHRYDTLDMTHIRYTFANLGDVEKVIVTTEKDAARLVPFLPWLQENKLPIYVQAMQIEFLLGGKTEFDFAINGYIEHEKRKLTS
jgi:tetraacyldisaccharide 4'-kinase